METEKEYITVRHKVSSIKLQGKIRKFVYLPLYITLIIISLVTLEPFLAIIGIAGLSYSIWCHFHWRKLLKGINHNDH